MGTGGAAEGGQHVLEEEYIGAFSVHTVDSNDGGDLDIRTRVSPRLGIPDKLMCASIRPCECSSASLCLCETKDRCSVGGAQCSAVWRSGGFLGVRVKAR